MTRSRTRRDHRLELETMMQFYLKKKLYPSRLPETWQKLWDEINDAYQKNQITDSEWDDLVNQYRKIMNRY